MTIRFRRFYTTIFVLVLQPLSHADTLFVSYSSAAGGGGIEQFSLSPQTPGTVFDLENAPVSSLTVAGNMAYWVSADQVYSDSLADAGGGFGKTPLPSVPFGGVTVSDLAVDPVTNSYLVGWIAPGFGWFIAQYPLTPNGNFNVFVNATNTIQGLTVVGNTAYWIEGTNIWSQNLDGTGKTLVQSFTLGNVSLSDLAVDPLSQTYLLAATSTGLPPLVARYPLTPQSSGQLFAFGNSSTTALTVSGDRAYWIDGSSVWSENLNGTDRTLQETLPSQFMPTDLAVSLNTPAAAPEPASLVLLGSGLIVLALASRQYQRKLSRPAQFKPSQSACL